MDHKGGKGKRNAFMLYEMSHILAGETTILMNREAMVLQKMIGIETIQCF